MRSKPLQSTGDVHLSPVFVGSVITCCESSQSIIEEFTAMEDVMLRSIPVIAYTRMFYAIIILTKLMVCNQSSNSGIGKILSAHSIRQTEYMYKAMTSLHTATGNEKFCVPSTFLSILTKLAAWCHQQQARAQTNGHADEFLVPMAFMKTTDNASEPYVKNSNQQPRNLRSKDNAATGVTVLSDERLGQGSFTSNVSARNSQAWNHGNLQQPSELNSSFQPLGHHIYPTILHDWIGHSQQGFTDSQPMDHNIAQIFHDFPDFDLLASLDQFEDSPMLKFVSDGNHLSNNF
jgi:hypothetical protein